MTAQELQDPDNVVLYAKPTLVIDAQLGQIDGSAFIWNGRGDGLSVNWLECFGNLPKERQLDTIRQLIRLQMRHSSARPASAEPGGREGLCNCIILPLILHPCLLQYTYSLIG